MVSHSTNYTYGCGLIKARRKKTWANTPGRFLLQTRIPTRSFPPASCLAMTPTLWAISACRLWTTHFTVTVVPTPTAIVPLSAPIFLSLRRSPAGLLSTRRLRMTGRRKTPTKSIRRLNPRKSGRLLPERALQICSAWQESTTSAWSGRALLLITPPRVRRRRFASTLPTAGSSTRMAKLSPRSIASNAMIGSSHFRGLLFYLNKI